MPPSATTTSMAGRKSTQADEPRRRRRSSLLGKAFERAGDTGPSIATGIAKDYTNGQNLQSPDSPASPVSSGDVKYPRSRRKRSRSLWRQWRRIAFTYTWTIPAVPILIFLALYAVNPTESNPISHFIFLSYEEKPSLSIFNKTSGRTQYGKGAWDFAFVFFYTLVLSFTREFIMGQFLRPLAKYSGIRTRGKQMRFMEQMYTAIYFGVMGPAGLYVMHKTPVWYFNTTGMYENFPHRTHFAEFKFYYLFQAAYWAQQALVMLLGMEKRRKDFKELVAHHIITLALIWLSYRFHFTYMGIAIYITHDISDLFLAVSKSLHYIDADVVIVSFASTIIMWTYCRHYLNLKILYSMLNEFETVGPYELNWDTQQYKCWISKYITFGLLASLQSLNLFWLYCLLRSAYKFVVYNTKKDDRSEPDESEEELEREKEAAKLREAAKLNGTKTTVNGTAKHG